MRAVVVVAEENSSGDKILRAKRRVVSAQNLHSLLIAFRTVGRAGTISVFGNHNRFARKRRVNLIEITPRIRRRARGPSPEVFVSLDKIHRSSGVALRRAA